jgi:hypothetical protein
METLAELHGESQRQARLTEILKALDEEPNVLVVFNHPLWDLYLIGKEKHEFLVNEFLQINGNYLHALELNGLRNWEENRAVRRLAGQWNMVLDLRRRPAWRGTERQYQPDQRQQLHRVCSRNPAGEDERHAVHAAVRRTVEASSAAIDD